MFEGIKDYLSKMPPNALSALHPEELEKYLFQEKENLSAYQWGTDMFLKKQKKLFVL
ncbi:hypothetical protein [Bacillus pseudomycoides]|uniref:hypothetical protein n=1 Tax=Bacillus pseudomycoides TaxID=64104 RepID=UPI001FB4A18A|nr:hypothetical protein [Bacillus pseudomycoides]